MSPSDISSIPFKIVTHNGAFHADDCMGVAILRLLNPNARVLRSRDPEVWRTADFLVDVGGEWNAATGRFDHHHAGFRDQPGSRRSDGVAYASAGLVWAYAGVTAVLYLAPDFSQSTAERIAATVDNELMRYLDMVDNGDDQVAPGLFGLTALLDQMVPTWEELDTLGPHSQQAQLNRAFESAVDICRLFLTRVLKQEIARERGAASVRASHTEFDGAVLVLNRSKLPWEHVVCDEMPAVKLVVYPDSTDDTFQVRTVPVRANSFEARMDLPASWAGLRDAELAQASGVPSANFCHTKRFICGANSLDGALAMAELALKA